MKYVLSLDQGTTSSRAILFDHDGGVAGTAAHEFRQIYPNSGWVEHEPFEILTSQLSSAVEVMGKLGVRPRDVVAVGITNQRETTIVWDRETGKPVYNAIVWQDGRTGAMMKKLSDDGAEETVRQKTGLLLSPYFSASKIAWILDNVEGARAKAEAGRLAFGTVDSWLVWNLTSGRKHITDRTNASRTLLYNIVEDRWDEDLLKLFGVPKSMLPEVVWSSERVGQVTTTLGLGEVEIAGIAGDQQSALFGQLCVAPGDAKNTYGTGCFLLQNIGEKFALSNERLVTTLGCSVERRPAYALEGSIFVGGAVVQWLRDNMKFFRQSSEVEAIADSVTDSGGVVFVPAFTGLGAPYWDAQARGLIIGLERGTQIGHIARAAIESIAFQVADVLRAMDASSKSPLTELRVDGGAAANDALMQFQADLLGVPVHRPAVLETTALGAAYLAGLSTGFWGSVDELKQHRAADTVFRPKVDKKKMERLQDNWREAVARSRNWAGGESMNRDEMLVRVRDRKEPWDIVVIGGGATGAGVAVDAATRGYDVLLLEREDFGKGTSSRATKLVHGGVRYLEQGNLSLVMEALKERGILLRNAPHIVRNLRFVVPNYSWWEAPFYGIGMKVYDLLAGKYSFGSSKTLSLEETLELLPTIRQDGLRGGVMYHDGQFDDTRLLIHLMMTAAEHGATVLNYADVVGLTKDADGFVRGVAVVDGESGERYTIAARAVVNATGIFADETRRLAEPEAEAMMVPSQGIHLVFERSFLTGDTALLVPHTDDGRVLFAVPWHNRTLVGTTDTPIDAIAYEPLPFEEEIEFVLETAGRYLSRKPTRDDILSVFVGIRPLAKSLGAGGGKTSAISRDYTIHIDHAGLVTIAGGKWTTYRHMAEDCVEHAITLGGLDERPCVTATTHIHGFDEHPEELGSLSVYGSDAAAILQLAKERPELGRPLHPDLPYLAAEVVWGARYEMARTVDDALSRRTRALLLNARAAVAIAPAVAALLAAELGKDRVWEEAQVAVFGAMAAQYIPQGKTYPAIPSE